MSGKGMHKLKIATTSIPLNKLREKRREGSLDERERERKKEFPCQATTTKEHCCKKKKIIRTEHAPLAKNSIYQFYPLFFVLSFISFPSLFLLTVNTKDIKKSGVKGHGKFKTKAHYPRCATPFDSTGLYTI